MTKKLKQNIQKFVISDLSNIEGYAEYEYSIIKTHPEFDQKKWNMWDDGGQLHLIGRPYDKTAQKMIKWAHKQVEKEVKELFNSKNN